MRSDRVRDLRRVVLCVTAVLLVIVGTVLWQYQTRSPLAVIWAGSDLQGEGRDGVVLSELLSVVKHSGYHSVDEALFLGDYSSAYDTEKSAEGLQIVSRRIGDALGLGPDEILFLQGNHDPEDTPGLDASGVHEREDYIVYMIHEGDFPSFSDEDNAYITEETAAKLDAYLQMCIDTHEHRPIFVMTHVPLHMNWREDNRYAKWLVDVLNEAGDAGLNLIVLYAHNHSDDYDSYLGGSCVYLAPGDTMLIPDPTAEYGQMAYETTEISFTYLNAGYVGFTATGEDGEARTCTVFAVYRYRVEGTRFDTDGVHDLKNAGTAGILDGGWAPDLTVVPGKMTIPLQ